MSTRYVYEIYDSTASRRSVRSVSLAADDFYKNISGYLCNDFSLSIEEDGYGNPVTLYSADGGESGDLKSMFNGAIVNTQYECQRTIAYKYAVLTVEAGWVNNKRVVDKSYLIEPHPSDLGAYWHSKYSGKSVDVWTSDSSNRVEEPANADKKAIMISGGPIEQGSTLLKTESSRTSLQTGAIIEIQGQPPNWRVLKGTDNIDPSAVSYSADDIYPGDSVTIAATPRTPTYGGTVYYLYQYSLDGGNTWASIGSRTTETSATVTIPEGAKQFQARVLASDGWGFTSATYVYGPAEEVSQLKAYVGIGGKAAAPKKGYVGIGGVAKELAKGYVGVGGVSKKLF